MLAMQAMQATRLDVGTLLHARQPFIVPKYQRAYAWAQEEINDFIGDLRKRWNDRVSGQPRPHFLGGIVSVHKIVANSTPGRMYEVVDGQQRLATCAMLLAALESGYSSISREARAAGDTERDTLSSSRASRLRRDYLEYDDEEDSRPVKRLRVVLSQADASFFESLMHRRGPRPSRASHERLLFAFSKLNAFVAALIGDQAGIGSKMECVQQLEKVITDDCYVVHLVTENRGEAYQLFQVLNDRGMGLSEGDLLRSTTLEMLEQSPEQQYEAEQLWDDILSGDVQEVEGFLRAYFASHAGRRAGQRSLFDDFLNFFFPTGRSAQGVIEVIKGLRTEIENYRKLIEGIWPYEQSTVLAWDRERLSLLISVLKHTLCIPLLLAACSSLPETSFTGIVQMLERTVFRYVIVARRHATKLGEVYLQHSGLIRRQPAYDAESLRQRLRSLLAEGAEDELFRVAVKEQMRYKQRGGNSALKYCLMALEQYGKWYTLGATGEPKCLDKSLIFDVASLQIEHIYPQNATQRDPGMEPLKDSFGNLSFWGPTDNVAASNSPFSAKRPIYAQSNISLNRDLSSLDSWTEDTLETRTVELVSRATKIFTL